MKKWYRSKTLWLNALLAAGTVAEANLGLIRDFFGPVAYLSLLSFAAAANAVLRVVTTKELH